MSGYLAGNVILLDMEGFRDKHETAYSLVQTKNVQSYGVYLTEKVNSYKVKKEKFIMNDLILYNYYNDGCFLNRN